MTSSNWLLLIGSTAAVVATAAVGIIRRERRVSPAEGEEEKGPYAKHYSSKGSKKAKGILTPENITALANKNRKCGYKLVVTQNKGTIHFGLLNTRNDHYHDLYLLCSEYVPVPRDNVDTKKLQTLKRERYWVSRDREEKSYLVDWVDLL